MNKKIVGILTALVCLVISFSGCGRKSLNGVQDLEVYVWDAGYGNSWYYAIEDLFKKQDWVKEKYPDLRIVMNHNDQGKYGEGRMKSGAKNNTIDLFFDSFGQNFAGKDKDGNEMLLDLTDVVYNTAAPGETTLIKEKYFKSFLESNHYPDQEAKSMDDYKYYIASWASGMDGFLYNEDILNSLNLKVPNTTDEMKDICDKILALKGNTDGKYNLGYTFIQGSDAAYWNYMFYIWWAQYEGVEGYYNYWNGIDDNTISKNIFTQQGRLEALKIFETLLNSKKEYLSPLSFSTKYMTSQTQFLQSHGVFQVNGDWFDNEMSAIRQELPEVPTIKMMKTPIISAIINRTPSITNDTVLSNVIAAVDAGEKSYDGVSDEDFKKIEEARTVVQSIGPNHTAYIPSYSNAKDIAVDFLRFMYSDIGLNAYIRATNGASLPLKYDLKSKDPDLYNSITDMQRSRLDYFSNPNYEVYILPDQYSFPLAKFGSLAPFKTDNSYYANFSAVNPEFSAQDYYDDTLEYWTTGRWENAINKAGIA